jgi:hypothetical protein
MFAQCFCGIPPAASAARFRTIRRPFAASHLIRINRVKLSEA